LEAKWFTAIQRAMEILCQSGMKELRTTKVRQSCYTGGLKMGSFVLELVCKGQFAVKVFLVGGLEFELRA
jgi:hypothetical protein